MQKRVPTLATKRGIALRSLSVLVMLLVLAVFQMSSGAGVGCVATAASPSSAGSPQYLEIWETLPDGTIEVRRVPQSLASPQPAQVCARPAPRLLSPAEGEQVDTLKPDYYWERVPSVFRYVLQVSRTPDFQVREAYTIFHDPNPAPGRPYNGYSLKNLAPDTVYYWHVASICEETGLVGPFSETRSFRSALAGGVILPAPALLAPPDGAATGSIRVPFSVGTVPGAIKYQWRFYHHANDPWDGWYRLVMSPNPLVALTFNPEETAYWTATAANAYAFGDPSGQRTFTTPPVTASAQISPDGGGTLTPDPGNISIQFPPGAVTAQTTLTYTLQAVPNHDLANFRFAGRAFTLEASDAHGPVTTFQQPYTLVITYDSTDLLAAGIGDPSRLNLLFWNGSTWENVLPCAGCSIDTVHQTVTVVLDHMTEFALAAPVETRAYVPVVWK